MGLVLSLLQPAHSHLNRKRLVKVTEIHGPIKPLKRLAEMLAEDDLPQDESLNYVLNNWHDMEFFRQLVIDPKRRTKSVVQDEYFISVGHAYQIALGAASWLLASTVDQTLERLPDPRPLEEVFARLKAERREGFYKGSPVRVAPLGALEILEGQARFSQIQYLYGGSGGTLTWLDFESCALLDSGYIDAFICFLSILEIEEWPATPDHSLVGLFLVICDLAMNPADGFLTELKAPASLIMSTDPGWRFVRFCEAVKSDSSLQSAIESYTSEEYWDVTDRLSTALATPSPRLIAETVLEWSTSHEGWGSLLKEDATFEFNRTNLPIRIIIAKFLSFQRDKLKTPEFFCWPGICTTSHRGPIDLDRAMQLFDEHAALFVDKPDGDVYPRILPCRDEQIVHEVFNDFYQWVASYELTRQWITEDGEFEMDFLWLTSKFSRDEIKVWAANAFKVTYGISPDTFRILAPSGN
ncbi:hypothetical protein [Undibacterium sp. Ji22W]|uniref:hypothetical protein n=1 Tax=Undibacterium sp. Ji22W TaxID=3413038 RepID=UPI003BEF6531